MSLIENFRSWWQDQTGEEDTPFDGDSFAFITSMIVHMCVLLALGLSSFAVKEKPAQVNVEAPIQEELKQDEMKVPEDFYFSDIPALEVGANSEGGEGVALSAGQIISEVSMVPTGSVEQSVSGTGPVSSEFGSIEINNLVSTSSGRTFSTMPVKGAAGEGTTGASGAVDRITYEILQQLEQRKTLVVWLFDQSPSMLRQRKEVKDRFDRVYRELSVIEAAGNKAFSKHDDSPLLTSLISFGDKVKLHTEKPVKDVEEIKQIVDEIPLDNTGNEKTFSAVYLAADLYKNLRAPDRETGQPKRNVMIIVFTDEIGDDDRDAKLGLEPTIKLCRHHEIPVYVVGVPAPFGRKETLVKWVDPDPKYDQSPQWGKVNQGPETFLPERVNLNFAGWEEDKEPLDSGFGPYALTRLAYETGGIYFAVHPNRNVNRTVSRNETEAFSAHISHFFDPEVMRRYKPEYVTGDEYLKRAKANKARAALVQAAQATEIAPPDKIDLRFVKRSEADLANQLSKAQESVAKLEPKLRGLYELLKQGESDRVKEFTPRWQAGYDLAMGRVMATMVRTEAYNQMLAKAKRGMKFEDDKNNTWLLEHSDDLKDSGTQLETAGKKAREYLDRVIADHPNTPWAMLAKKELEMSLGYRWKEEFTDLAPARMGGGGGNNNNNAPANDAKKMIQKGPPKREVPKL